MSSELINELCMIGLLGIVMWFLLDWWESRKAQKEIRIKQEAITKGESQ